MAFPGNVDRHEIERFDNISMEWWDAQGEMRTLHTINPLRVHFIMENNVVVNPQILDVGCGGGILTEALAKTGARVTGIDLSQASIEVARQHAQKQGLSIHYLYGDVAEFTMNHAGSYDIVACMEMLEHVPHPEKIIEACSQALRPGGQAYFSSLNRTLKTFLFAIVIGENFLHLLPRGSHKYHRLIRPNELKHWGSRYDLAFVRLASLMYNPFTRRFKVAPGKEDVSYMAHFIKQVHHQEG